MNIGIPKEIKKGEHRIAITSKLASELVKKGHVVFIEKLGGVQSGFSDQEFKKVGAIIAKKHIVWQQDLILKVKEPVAEEYKYLKPNQILFSYLHLVGSPKKLTETLINNKVSAIQMETVEKNGILNLAGPMSEIAGRMAVEMGAFYLQKHLGGKGVLIDGIIGASPANVIIIGAGTAGLAAAESACSRNAIVYLLDVRKDRRDRAKKSLRKYGSKSYVLSAESKIITKLVKIADLIIGAALLPGDRTPHLISRKMIKTITPGSVMVDISIDQGGCFETSISRTHLSPITKSDNIIHYAVPNMPGAFPKTATMALVHATTPYIIKLANLGIKAIIKDKGLAKGLATYNGVLYSTPVSRYFHLPYKKYSKSIFNK